ncbi:MULTISPECIES: PepSY domain-containing protein [unclassified Pandoraea]|uniref:PepSY domain-containing protein n=1 Tax=unclassified Pandoraea TaxID=2624094 RepID=UPI00101AFEBF|nr:MULTISPECIES: PepSY domain-containing protein [unclassified Pandoraea]QBC31828.1 peptidase M4 [Pandoraea sp. XY-2]BDD94283.1 peptidase [Pandoraea sp. NE5]
MNGKQRKRAICAVLGALTPGVGLLGSAHAAGDGTTQSPAYQSSIKVPNQQIGERGEAARLAALAKIDATRATAAALAQVPGTVLKVALDNENGNLVYSVEIKTAGNEIKDVKVDPGNGAVVHVDIAGDQEDTEE